MHPTSVFSYDPESIEPLTLENTSLEQPETLEDLHDKVVNQELLCYFELLETRKPYLTNVVRMNALPVMLLLSTNIMISFDLKHFIIDKWLHLTFENEIEASKILPFGIWLRYAWKHLVDSKLQSFDKQTTKKIKTHIMSARWDQVPPIIKKMKEKWISMTSLQAIDAEDVTDGINQLFNHNLEFNICRIKMPQVQDWFGYDPFSPLLPNERIYRVTPHFTYFGPSHEMDTTTAIFQDFTEEMLLAKTQSAPPKPVGDIYSCTVCGQDYHFTKPMILRHKRNCK